ncbi:MAG: carboxylesterase family protein, partial [Bacteroidia bacterium]
SSHGEKVYVYRFARKPPATGEYVKYGAFHTAEVPYAYDNLQFVNRPWQPVDHELATIMSTYWANFARTGNPNGNGLPVWDEYDPGKKIMLLNEKPETITIPDKNALDFLYNKMKLP